MDKLKILESLYSNSCSYWYAKYINSGFESDFFNYMVNKYAKKTNLIQKQIQKCQNKTN